MPAVVTPSWPTSPCAAPHVLEQLQLRPPHVGSLKHGVLPEQRAVDGARGRDAVPHGISDQHGHEPFVERAAGELDELRVVRVACRLVCAVPNPEQHGLAGVGAVEPSGGPVDDGARESMRRRETRREAGVERRPDRRGTRSRRSRGGACLRAGASNTVGSVPPRPASRRKRSAWEVCGLSGSIWIATPARTAAAARYHPSPNENPGSAWNAVGMISLADDPPRVLCRRLGRVRRSPRRRIVEQQRQPRGFERRRLGDADNLLDAPPAVVAVVARGGALGAE